MVSDPVFSTGGTVQASGGIYIRRPADDELFQLCMEGRYAHVLTSRQMGKSSLRVAVAERLRKEDIQIAAIDLTSIGTQANAEQWYFNILEKIEQDLRLTTLALDWWESNQHLTPTNRFSRYLFEVALSERGGRVVVFIDEIDTTLNLPFRDDFFASIRWLWNARAEIAAARRLSFVLIGSTTPGDLIQDRSRTPFNISSGVVLTDFSEQDAQPLVTALSSANGSDSGLLHRIFEWTGGHPYLTQRLCTAAATSPAEAAGVDALVKDTFLASGDRKDPNIEWVRDMLTKPSPARDMVLSTWRDVLRGRSVPDEEASVAKSHLKLTGVVRSTNGYLKARNRIYNTAFDEKWVLNHLPQDLERQRRLTRYKKISAAALSVAALSVVVIGIMGWLLRRAHIAEATAAIEREETQLQRDKALREKDRAVIAQKRAETAENNAALERDNVRAAQRETKRERDNALREKDRAVIAQNEAESQRAEAEAAKREAEKQTKIAADRESKAESFATRAEREAIVASARRLAADALEMSTDRLDLALLLGLEANRRAPLPDVSSKLLTALLSNPSLTGFLRPAHTNGVRGLAFSPDGSRLASSSVDGSILIWDVASHRRIFRPLAHSGEVYTGAFHPNGKMLASGSSDQTIRIWNVDTGLPLGPPSRAPEAVYGVAFSPDGRRLASACKNGTVVLWNVSESPVANPLSIIKTLNAHDGNAYSVAFSSDGKTLASAGSDNKIVLSDGDTGRPLPVSPLKGHTNEVFTVAFSPTNPNRLASGGMDTSIRLWDITTGKPIGQPLKQHSRTVFMINFSPDGAKLASVALDAKTLLWDITATNPTSRALTGYREGALSVAFSPVKGSTTLASGSVNGDVVLWDVPTRKWLGTPVESLTDWVYRVKFSPDRDTLAATTAGNQIMLWSQSTAQVIGSLKGHSKHIKSLDFSPDGKTLASASEDGSVILWDLGTHKRRGAPLSEHQGSVEAVAWSHDGKMLASGGTDSTVILRDGHTGSPLPSSPLNNGASVLTLAFSRDGHFLASGADSDIILWDISLPHPTEMRLHGHEERPAHGQLPVHQGHSRLVTSVEFSPDSKTLASGSHDRNVILWDVASRRQRMVLYGHEDAVTSIAFSPDGAILASASEDRSVILWDVATGRQLGPPLREHNAKVHSVAFSPDGKTLASGSNKESDNWALILWDVNPESWQSRACDVAARNITSDEWERYVGASARDITCPTALLWDADARALENRTPEASREFQHLVDLALKSSNPELSNEVCWFGSIHRFAEIVMPACERAVSLDPSNGAYHDSKALAHAVMGVGGRQDALKHLEIFIKWARNKPTLAPQLAKRKIWIDALNLGQNPFDDEATLRSLRFESNGREASK